MIYLDYLREKLRIKRNEQCPYFSRNPEKTSKIACLIQKTPELVAEHCKNKENPCFYLLKYGYAKESE
jgi:hypothetical protein